MTPSRKPLHVAALIPAYQAAAHLGEVLMRLAVLEEAPEVLVVDDGSRDATAEVARRHGARVLAFAANRGKGHALLAGFRALAGYDAVVSLDADGQHPPESFPDFVRAAETGVDVVLGYRRFDTGMPALRRFANGWSSAWASLAAGRRISDSQCGYRLYRREVLTAVPVRASRYEVESEMAVRAARLGFRIAEIEVPTVYGGETSHIRLHRDVPRILGMLARLSLEALSPPAEMRAAYRARLARTGATESTPR
ncbi:MAG: glycosyltransferase family 2 protein [Candidatus Eisenbacteria bacterium]